MRLSLALANNCISSPSDFNWIHSNNQTFKSSLAELNKAEYTFTILRCPYARLASVYLDKFVERNLDAWQYVNTRKREIDISNITFSSFIKSLKIPHIRNSNIHWKNQSHFLIYEQ